MNVYILFLIGLLILLYIIQLFITIEDLCSDYPLIEFTSKFEIFACLLIPILPYIYIGLTSLIKAINEKFREIENNNHERDN